MLFNNYLSLKPWDRQENYLKKSNIYLRGEMEERLRNPLKSRQAVPFPRISVHQHSSCSCTFPKSSSALRIRRRGELARGFGKHLPDARRVEVNMEVGRDLAALGDIKQRQADEERFHLEFGREKSDAQHPHKN